MKREKKKQLKKKDPFSLKIASTNDLFVRLAAPQWLILRNCHPLLTSGNKILLRNRETDDERVDELFSSREERR